MKTKITLIIIALLALSCEYYYAHAQYQPKALGELIVHEDYSLSYNEEFEQADWVYYIVKPGDVARHGSFKKDKLVSTESASASDYGDPYDRGHLKCALDSKNDSTAMQESMLMSNISPQYKWFNRGIWKKKERYVHDIGIKTITYVVTGPVFKDNKGTIGKNDVVVPGFFYTVLYQPETNLMIAFFMPNEKSDKDIEDFIVSVDFVEEVTGIDFFYQLPDELEYKLEK